MDQTSAQRASWMPALGWLRQYDRKWIRADLVAGLTLAAYLLPAGLGDASLANLPAQAGLYACLFSGLVFWLFCSSRHTAITVTSAISLLIGASLGEIAGGDQSRFGALAAFTALLMAGLALIAWMFNAGSVVSFVSESVMVGFKCGVALFLGSTQLPKLFGFGGVHGGSFWHRMGHFFSHIHETNSAALKLGLIALAILLAGRAFLKNRPVALFVVIGAIVAASIFSLESRGVKMLGKIDKGLPPIVFPIVTPHEANEVLPLALACFLLGAVETVAIGRMFVAKHGGKFNTNKELLALAAANAAAGFGQGLPVSGGMSQSLVNESGGAKTPLSGFIAAVIVLIVILFLAGALKNLPQPVLAAIVLVAVLGLFKLETLKFLWRTDKREFIVAAAALVGVLGSGLLRGVLIGAVISLVQLLRRASRPHVAVLGRIPGSRRFSDHSRNPDNEPVPGFAIYRPESSLVYFNIEHIRDTIFDTTMAMSERPRMVILDLSAAPYVDLQSAEVLSGMADDLKEAGIQIRIVESRSKVRDRLRSIGVDEKLGGINRHNSVIEAVEGAGL